MSPPATLQPQRPSAPRTGLLCQCTGVTCEELREALAAKPRASLDSVCAALGCGTECGSCLPQIQELAGQVAWHPASARATPVTRASHLREMERLIYRVELTLRSGAAYPRALPGQHVVLRATVGQQRIERTYTVIGQDVERGKLSLGIRRTPGGKLTPWLLDGLDEGEARPLEVSVPAGRPLGSGGRRPDVFFAGGVGITPAVAMAATLAREQRLHVHYSVTHADDAAFLPDFDARRAECPGISYTVHETAAHGPVQDSAIRKIARSFPGARFYICGPEGYVEVVRRALARAGIDPARIHVELFALAGRKAPVRTSRSQAWFAGALLAALPLLFLQPMLEPMRPHGHPNVGHEQLKCTACHVESTASTRQVLQAKAKHLLGLRQTGAAIGPQVVTPATCIQCHANADDRHPTHRFLEPRFEQARAETGAQLCASCHREHAGTRTTMPTASYCASCHQDLVVKNDRASPTHAALIAGKRWETCMQCHDYHGNHRWTPPRRIEDGASLELLQKYLKGGPSPYGSTIVKAKEATP